MTKHSKYGVFLLIGLAIGVLVMYLLTSVFGVIGVNTRHNGFPKVAPKAGNDEIIDLAMQVVKTIEDKDYDRLSEIVHPVYGVIFTPYSTVAIDSDKCFTALEVKNFDNNSANYIWGKMDGTGNPIEMSPNQYFEKYVYDKPYANAPLIGINTVVRTGNALENVKDVFPNGIFVDFSFPGTTDGAMQDWSTLRLVFEEYGGGLMLSAIIHCQYTI